MNTKTNDASMFAIPPVEELRGASKTALLHCLDLLARLALEGVRPPDGYLFELSKQVMRSRAEAAFEERGMEALSRLH